MDIGEYFDSLSKYSYEDMQKNARMKEAEKAAAKSNGDDEPKTVEKTTIKVEGDGDELSKYVNRWMTPDEFKKQAGKVIDWRKKKSDLSQDDPIGFPEHTYYHFGDPGVVSHGDFIGINGLKEKIADAGGDPAAVDEVLFNHFKDLGFHVASSGDDLLLQDSTAYGPDASLLVSPTDVEELIKLAAEDKEPEGDETTAPEEIAKHVSEKIRATSEFMEPEEFNKLLMGKASSDGSDNVLSDESVKKEC